MSHFDLLHPALRHHIVNSLGWRELRPFQEEVIPGVLDGQNLIVLAPTAGGKTEAALFPTLSRMLSEGWNGLSVLYICPIKALLNNLDSRLQRYCTLLGRSSSLWHGDVKPAARKRILREPPDCLLTTPESLEVMLVSTTIDARRLFRDLRVVIVDEVHAFAGDDRGWHLLSVLERISRLAGRELQRIGLSATVGNPEELLEWLAGSSRDRQGAVCGAEVSPTPLPHGRGSPDVTLDFVGSLENAAVVISRLHRGEKRLVFIDSRARAEQLGLELRQLGVTVFVTHSSLSPEQRQQAEDAFVHRDDCVIVATSVLELGIDVGNLDRVIQIDSPATVSSFLQRMGRTGRRTGSIRNCLFLTTREETLLQAAGLLDLWASGYIEPVNPPLAPYHVLAQQLLALILQEGGIGRRTWREWIDGVSAFARMPICEIDGIVQGMLNRNLLWDEEGILGIGKAGEEAYGRRHFMELLSVFLSPPLFTVLHGRQEIGFVDQLTFQGKSDGPRVLLLGGRSWRVTHVDWPSKVAYVEAAEDRGRSRWKGEGRGLSFRLCQAIKSVLTTDAARPCWSQRARERLVRLRQDFAWLEDDSTVVLTNGDGENAWWTFAGLGANATLAAALSEMTDTQVTHESLSVMFPPRAGSADIESAIKQLRQRNLDELLPVGDEQALQSLKFSDCLPKELALQVLQQRLHDPHGVKYTLQRAVRFVSASAADGRGDES